MRNRPGGSRSEPGERRAVLAAVRRRSEFGALAAALGIAACATATLPTPEVAARARSIGSYSARLRVSLSGPQLRARTRALLAFRRPDALRIEVPGPTGARLVVVMRGGRLWAVFPGERAVFESAATSAELADLLGVALSPTEMMDLLVGVPSSRLRGYQARWGPLLPREVEALLPDGARLRIGVEEPDTAGLIADAAFAVPPHDGYRSVGAEEARQLWSRP